MYLYSTWESEGPPPFPIVFIVGSTWDDQFPLSQVDLNNKHSKNHWEVQYIPYNTRSNSSKSRRLKHKATRLKKRQSTCSLHPNENSLFLNKADFRRSSWNKLNHFKDSNVPTRRENLLPGSDVANILFNVDPMPVGDITWLDSNEDIAEELTRIKSEVPQETQQPSKEKPRVTGPVLSDISEDQPDQPEELRYFDEAVIENSEISQLDDRDSSEEEIPQRSPQRDSKTSKASTSSVIRKKSKVLNPKEPSIIENISIKPADKAASLLSGGDELLVENPAHTVRKLAEKESYLIMARGLINADKRIIESLMYSLNEELFYNSLRMAVYLPKNTRNHQSQRTYRHRGMISRIYN
ncbi:hypothetical protein QAD02_002688 [Eretmocerus hayati]|uniref:Uncharacterized protein n=1 Tax=Eretmocerus hayati TaxID=131215 RepID=A0ACC2NJY2_9HYME|nr:hypothetical protein QAD02_002688 [Eretmocerus hayati]